MKGIVHDFAGGAALARKGDPMERQISETELKHVDLGGAETAAEGRENAGMAATIDALFADEWEGGLREICTQALQAEANETGLQEACRRAFREGFWTGQRERGADRPPAAAPSPRSTA
ncbi:MAG: hypothetical protein ACTHMJ_06125 [Thermomicrobiales bacterium]